MEAVNLRLLRWRRPVWCQISVFNCAHGKKNCADTSGTHSLGIFVILRSEFSYLRRIEDGWFGVEGCRSGST